MVFYENKTWWVREDISTFYLSCSFSELKEVVNSISSNQKYKNVHFDLENIYGSQAIVFSGTRLATSAEQIRQEQIEAKRKEDLVKQEMTELKRLKKLYG